MTSFDACRFDFRLDDKKGLTPSYRRRHAHRARHAHSVRATPNQMDLSGEDESEEGGGGGGGIEQREPQLKQEEEEDEGVALSPQDLEPGEVRYQQSTAAPTIKQEIVYNDDDGYHLSEQRAFTTPTAASSSVVAAVKDKAPVRRQRKRRALIAGSGQLTMCSYCSGLFDDRKSLLSHQLTDLQCQEKQETKDGQISNSQYRMAVLRKLKRLTNNKVALKQEKKVKTENETPPDIDNSAVSLGTISLLRDLVKHPTDCFSTPLSPFATPLEPLPFPLPEQTTATNLSLHKRTAVVAPLVQCPAVVEEPIDLSCKPSRRVEPRIGGGGGGFFTTRMQLKHCKPTGKLSLTEVATLKCQQCGMTVSRASFMAAHRKRWHSDDTTEEEEVQRRRKLGGATTAATDIACMWCEFRCSDETAFVDHVKQNHHN